MRRITTCLLLAALLVQATACGTLLYPERRGQTSGKIDPGVAVLDGVGLLVFLIPGLIAFGVDFSTGAIYLPGTGTAAAAEPQVLQLDPAGLSADSVAAAVQSATGARVDLADPAIEVHAVASRSELVASLDAHPARR